MSTAAERLAEEALEAVEKCTDPEKERICLFIADRAMAGMSDSDVEYFRTTLRIHTRNL